MAETTYTLGLLEKRGGWVTDTFFLKNKIFFHTYLFLSGLPKHFPLVHPILYDHQVISLCGSGGIHTIGYSCNLLTNSTEPFNIKISVTISNEARIRILGVNVTLTTWLISKKS